MSSRVSLNVSLTPELDQFVQERVSTGRYQTASETVQEGLRLLERHERDQTISHAAWREKLQRSATQAERGEHVQPDKTLEKIKLVKARRAAAKP